MYNARKLTRLNRCQTLKKKNYPIFPALYTVWCNHLSNERRETISERANVFILFIYILKMSVYRHIYIYIYRRIYCCRMFDLWTFLFVFCREIFCPQRGTEDNFIQWSRYGILSVFFFYFFFLNKTKRTNEKKTEETTEKLNFNHFLFLLFLVSPAPNESVLRL